MPFHFFPPDLMKILNPAIIDDLDEGRKLRLNLGCGQRQLPGYYGVDVVALPGVDILADLNEPLDLLPDDCVTEIATRHVLEHVPRFLELLGELHRLCCADARIDITVPHFSNPYGYSDPTHVRFFGLYSFYYFADESDQPSRKVPSFYRPERFRIESVRIRLLKAALLDRLVQPWLEPIINLGTNWLDWYERRLCRWVPASEVRYVLRPVKQTQEPHPSREQRSWISHHESIPAA